MEQQIHLQYCAKVTQAKCANFVLCFTRNFQESSRESSSDNSRSLDRNFPRTKNAISSNFPYERKFHDDKRRFTNSVPEISRWTDTTIPRTIYSIYPSYNVGERYTEVFNTSRARVQSGTERMRIISKTYHEVHE